MKSRPSDKLKQKGLAQEHITSLFAQAQNIFPHSPSLAHEYVELARKVAMRVKAKIPLMYKRRFCKFCYHYLVPGVNSRVRTRSGKVVISCLDCKKFMRVPMH